MPARKLLSLYWQAVWQTKAISYTIYYTLIVSTAQLCGSVLRNDFAIRLEN